MGKTKNKNPSLNSIEVELKANVVHMHAWAHRDTQLQRREHTGLGKYEELQESVVTGCWPGSESLNNKKDKTSWSSDGGKEILNQKMTTKVNVFKTMEALYITAQ